MSDIVEVTSGDGLKYRRREAPCEVTLACRGGGAAESVVDDYGFAFHHVFVPANALRTVCLPLDANPREPTRVDVVKRMEETLRESPSNFHHWNNGITVVCKSVDFGDNDLRVSFLEGDGICNGGHTYFSIVTFPARLPDDCMVHLELIELPEAINNRRQVINDIAARRNRNRALSPTTQADFLGHYDPFRAALGVESKQVSWHEGDSNALPNAIRSELLVRLMASLDPFWYRHPVHGEDRPNHKQVATSSSKIHSDWFEGAQGADPTRNLNHMAALLPDILRLRDFLSFDLRHGDLTDVKGTFRNRLIYQNWLAEKKDHVLAHYKPGKTGCSLSAPAQLMILGYFRSNIWLCLDEDGEPSLIGWLRDPIDLWNETRAELLEKLANDFQDADNDPSQFIKRSGPYDFQLVELNYGKFPPAEPEMFIDLASRIRYKTDSSGDFGLDVSGEGFGSLTSASDAPGDKTYSAHQ